MKKHFSERNFLKVCNPVRLFALGLFAFAAPAFATTVAHDFTCSSQSNSAGCFLGKQRLHANLDQVSANSTIFAFSEFGSHSAAKGKSRNIKATSFGGHDKVSFTRDARPPHLFDGTPPKVDFNTYFSPGTNKRKSKSKHDFNERTGRKHAPGSLPFLHKSFDHPSLYAALINGEFCLVRHPRTPDDDINQHIASQPPAAVPLPASVWLFASGLFGFAGIVRRRHSQ